MIWALAWVLLGLIALVFGGDLLVRGAVRLAERAGIRPLIIGIVIIGCGTSLPELVTSVEAVLAGAPAIAWGNIAGSNIANGLLILGAVALVAPLHLGSERMLRDPVIALGASVFLLLVAGAAFAHWALGAVMLAALAAYILWCYYEEKMASPIGVHNAPHDRAEALEMTDEGLHAPDLGVENNPSGAQRNGWFPAIALTLGGLAILILGGKLLVSGAIDLSRMAGLSETMIGLTIVAIGTSLPELVTSLIAARKGETEIAFGNVVGSNIYNLLGIGGATMLIAPDAIPAQLFPVDLGLVAVSAGVLLLLAFVRGVNRLTGAGLVAAYFAYLGYLIVTA